MWSVWNMWFYFWVDFQFLFSFGSLFRELQTTKILGWVCGLGKNTPCENVWLVEKRMPFPTCVLLPPHFLSFLRWVIKLWDYKNVIGQLRWRSWSSNHYKAPGTTPAWQSCPPRHWNYWQGAVIKCVISVKGKMDDDAVYCSCHQCILLNTLYCKASRFYWNMFSVSVLGCFRRKSDYILCKQWK